MIAPRWSNGNIRSQSTGLEAIMLQLPQTLQTRLLNGLMSAGSLTHLISQLKLRSAFVQSDLQSAQDGVWQNFDVWDRVAVIFHKAAGTAGDDPLISTQQAQDGAGT